LAIILALLVCSHCGEVEELGPEHEAAELGDSTGDSKKKTLLERNAAQNREHQEAREKVEHKYQNSLIHTKGHHLINYQGTFPARANQMLPKLKNPKGRETKEGPEESKIEGMPKRDRNDPWSKKDVRKYIGYGKELAKNGWPQQKMSKKAKLYEKVNPQKELAGGTAEDEVYHPLVTHMTADDAAFMNRPMERMVKLAEKAQEQDRIWKNTLNARDKKEMKAAQAAIVAKVKGQSPSMLKGTLLRELGLQTGNYLHCMSQLKECNAAAHAEVAMSLGEAATVTQEVAKSDKYTTPKYTAVQEDRIARGVDEPDHYEKFMNKKHPERFDTPNSKRFGSEKTAVQEYADTQRGGVYRHFSGLPGDKMEHDKMTMNEVKWNVKEGGVLQKEAERLDKEDDKRINAAIKKKDAKALQQLSKRDEAADFMRQAMKSKGSPNFVQKLEKMTEKLGKCLTTFNKKKCSKKKLTIVNINANTTHQFVNTTLSGNSSNVTEFLDKDVDLIW